jgi:tetratricopeptide (TPR) repeat protein
MRASVKKRQPGLRIRPGSVREAREEAGISLGKVAGSDLSRTAIFLIEKGRARPTMGTLQLIASRTGKPLEFFLEEGAEDIVRIGQHRFDEIERLMAQGRFREAIDCGHELLESKPARDDEARVRLTVAQAHIRLQEPDEAEAALGPARRYYEVTSNKWMLLECQAIEIAVLIEREDPAARRAAEAGLASVRALKPVPADMEMKMLQRVAIAAVLAHEWKAAIKAFEECVEVAGSLHDMDKMALIYGDLANAYQQAGELELAARYSRRSIAAHEMLNNRYGISVAERNLALAMLKLGDAKSAEQHLERSLHLLEESGVDRPRSGLLVNMAEVRLAQGRLQDARAKAEAAIELATRLDEPSVTADANFVLGQIAEAEGDPSEADTRIHKAIAILSRINMVERLVRAHNEYAELLEARGDLAAAHRHLKQVIALTRPDLRPRTREAEAALAALA